MESFSIPSLTHSEHTSLSHVLTCHSHALVATPYANGQCTRSTIRDRKGNARQGTRMCIKTPHVASNTMMTKKLPWKNLKASTGVATYKTKFNPSWQAKFLFVSRSDSIYSFHWNVCRKDVSCSHEGINDLKGHEKSLAH